MNPETDWLFVLVSFFSFFGFIVFLVIFFANKSFSPRLLAAIIFCVSYTLFHFGLSNNKAMLELPFLYRSPVFFTLCIPPLTFIYTRTLLKQDFRFSRSDLIFLLIAVFYTLRFLPVYLSNGNEKLELIKQALADKSFYASEIDAWLPGGWGITFRIAYGLLMSIAGMVMLKKSKGLLPNQQEVIVHNKEIYQWLAYFNLVMSLTYLLLLCEFGFQLSRYVDIYWVMSITVSGTILFVSAYLLLKPEILYGIRGWRQISYQIHENPYSKSDLEKRVAKPAFTYEKGQKIKALILECLEGERPYLKCGYSIRDLSNQTKVPVYQVSAFINHEFGKNFNEFINDLRVDYLLSLTSNSTLYLNYTLEALGNIGGFKSRSAFISAVKRRTGKTPSQVFGDLVED